MKLHLAAGLAAITFLAGILVGVIVSGLNEHERPASNPEVGIGPKPESSERPKTRQEEPARTETAVAPAHVADMSGNDEWLRVLKAVAAEPVETMPSVDGVISGTVTDVQGNGVPGVEISLLPQARSKGVRVRNIKSPDDAELWRMVDEAARNAVKSYASPWMYRVTGTTGPDGRYEVGGLVDTTYTVGAARTGYALKALGPVAFLKPGSRLDWQAWRAQTLEARVERPAGVAHPQMFVHWERDDGQKGTTYIHPDEPAKVQIPPGRCAVWAEERTLAFRSDRVELTIVDGADPAPVTLQLRMPPKLIITVDTSRGAPVHELSVRYARRRPELSESEHFEYRRGLGQEMQRQAEQWQSGELPPGRYVAGVWCYEQVLATATLEVSDRAAEHRFALEPPPTARGITCAMTFARDPGHGRPEFTLWGVRKDGRTASWTPRNAWRLEGNRYLVVLGEGDTDEPAAADAIVCKFRTLGPLRREGTFNAGSTVEFAFAQPQEATAVISGVPTALNRGVNCSVESVHAGKFGVSWTSAHDGRATVQLGALQPGEYTLSVRGGVRVPTPVLVAKGFSIAPGKSAVVEVQLPQLFEVTILQPAEKVLWARITWDGIDPEWESYTHLQFDKDGACILPCLPAGRYTIKYNLRTPRPEAKEKTFDISGTATVQLTE